jgi:serine protease Do
VTLGRLEDGENLAGAEADQNPQTPEGTDQAEPPAADLPASDIVLGMKLAVLDAESRKTYGISKDVEGVVIAAVQPQSAAAERRIAPGDVIVEIGQEAMKTPEDVSARVEELKADGRRNALLMIANKAGELRFVTVRME